jgi:hypothetical protein
MSGFVIYLFWYLPEGFEPAAFRTARLGPRPARPSCAPTAERPPAPHACSTRRAVLRVCLCGTGGVATQHGTAASSRVSSCEPPRTSRTRSVPSPPHKRRRYLCGGVSCTRRACATAAQHARPHAVRLRAHRVSRSASCRTACCLLAMHRASASTAARTGADGPFRFTCMW